MKVFAVKQNILVNEPDYTEIERNYGKDATETIEFIKLFLTK